MGGRLARDIMTKNVITVSPDTPVSELASLFMEHRINGVPVVGTDGVLLGVVTQEDLIDQQKKVHIPTVISLFDSVFFLESPKRLDRELKKMTGMTAGDVCSRNVVTVKEDTPIEDIATIIAERRIHTIPVVDEGRLVGIIGRIDIIRTLLPDEKSREM